MTIRYRRGLLHPLNTYLSSVLSHSLWGPLSLLSHCRLILLNTGVFSNISRESAAN